MIAILALCTLTGCATGGTSTVDGPVLRDAVDTPAAFTFPTPPSGPDACTSPAVDPRDGTMIRFVRAARGIGDYLVPEGRYGVRTGEVLRIRCTTGEVVGIVRR